MSPHVPLWGLIQRFFSSAAMLTRAMPNTMVTVVTICARFIVLAQAYSPIEQVHDRLKHELVSVPTCLGQAFANRFGQRCK